MLQSAFTKDMIQYNKQQQRQWTNDLQATVNNLVYANQKEIMDVPEAPPPKLFAKLLSSYCLGFQPKIIYAAQTLLQMARFVSEVCQTTWGFSV